MRRRTHSRQQSPVQPSPYPKDGRHDWPTHAHLAHSMYCRSHGNCYGDEEVIDTQHDSPKASRAAAVADSKPSQDEQNCSAIERRSGHERQDETDDAECDHRCTNWLHVRKLPTVPWDFQSAALGIRTRKPEALKGRNNRNVPKVAIHDQPPFVSPFQGSLPDEQQPQGGARRLKPPRLPWADMSPPLRGSERRTFALTIPGRRAARS
jgi:hypothetical protein